MKLPREVRGVVFDMDGLLVDTEAVFRDVMMEASAARGLDLPMEVFLRMVGLPHQSSREVAMAHFGEAFDYHGWMGHAWELAHARLEAGAPVKAGVAELLDVLEAAAIPRAIATSSALATVERYLAPIGLLQRFQAVVSAGDCARGKPAPDPFVEAARRLGVAPADCLALEDSHNGVRAASAAGMMTVMAPDLLPANAEMRRLAIAVVDDLHEVAAWLAP